MTDIQLSGLTPAAEEDTLCMFFSGPGVSAVTEQYASGDAEAIAVAANTLLSCALAVQQYAYAGRKIVALAQLGVAEGTDCRIGTKRWQPKPGRVIEVSGEDEMVTFGYYKDNGELGPLMRRKVSSLVIETSA